MAYIRQIADDEATGGLKKHYDSALKRAGKVFGIVRVMSLNERMLADSMRFYISIMKPDAPLSRRRCEMLAVVVSKTNDCRY